MLKGICVKMLHRNVLPWCMKHLSMDVNNVKRKCEFDIFSLDFTVFLIALQLFDYVRNNTIL